MLSSASYLLASMIFAFMLAIISFEHSKIFGRGIIYAYMGILQIIATIAATFLYHRALALLFSIGSIAFFPTILSIILMLYIFYGREEARNGAYVIILMNVVMDVIFVMIFMGMGMPNTINLHYVPSEIFISNIRTSLSGTIITIIDIIILVFVYELTSMRFGYRKGAYMFMPIFLSMMATLMFDAVAFVTLAFYGLPYFIPILKAHIAGKFLASVIFSIMIWVYFQFISHRTGTWP